MIFNNLWAQFWCQFSMFRLFSLSANLQLIVTFIRHPTQGGRPIIPYPAFKVQREALNCPSRGLMPQRCCTGFPAETMTKQYSLRSINFNGFF